MKEKTGVVSALLVLAVIVLMTARAPLAPPPVPEPALSEAAPQPASVGAVAAAPATLSAQGARALEAGRLPDPRPLPTDTAALWAELRARHRSSIDTLQGRKAPGAPTPEVRPLSARTAAPPVSPAPRPGATERAAALEAEHNQTLPE